MSSVCAESHSPSQRGSHGLSSRGSLWLVGGGWGVAMAVAVLLESSLPAQSGPGTARAQVSQRQVVAVLSGTAWGFTAVI